MPDLEPLRLGEVVDVVDDAAVFVDCRHRIGLVRHHPTAGTADRRDDRLVRVDVAGDDVEFHLGRDDRAPALFGVKLDHPLEHVARRHRHRVALLVVDVVDDLKRHVGGPRNRLRGGEVRHQDHVGFGEFLPPRHVGIIAGDGLGEDRVRQVEELLLGELRSGHRLALGHAGKVGDEAFDLVETAAGDVVLRGFRQFLGPVGHESHCFQLRFCLKKSAIRSAIAEEEFGVPSFPEASAITASGTSPLPRVRISPSTKSSENSGWACTVKARSP